MNKNYEVVKYLYECSNDLRDDGWTTQKRGWLLKKCVEGDMFDVALRIVKIYPRLESGEVLKLLALKPEAFSETKSNKIKRNINSVFSLIGLTFGAYEKESKALQVLKIIWEDIAKRPRNEIDSILRGLDDPVVDSDSSADSQRGKNSHTRHYSSQVMFIATEKGNTTFLAELIRRYPDLICKVNDNNMSIFHIAVKYRHEGIHNLLNQIGSMKDFITTRIDGDGNNMLHLAGMSTTKERLADVSGAALQMQRELLWFKEVSEAVPFYYKEQKNNKGLTPRELFSKEHEELIKEGEKWLKDTASHCMVVATLIATMVFAAAFTIPGGYNQTDGIPVFYRKPIFIAFVVSDAMSLFLSSTSILTFLSILTSRFAARDFVKTLPIKLMLGITTLFLSITAMMISFSVSFFILYNKEMKWVPILLSFTPPKSTRG
ncbi:putative ankyrin repeat-containing domain, PGG domain, ankyrin repeat-containing domain superfamily [Helianthus annuus]|uniref:Ankyrin repeat-containing domain, PGG domain, ankyrin repeat-containing domain superfamily n=3 Tax=Helianthus annuus TaxID=4232 RepID=A0A9K3E8E4_HELAN|nr:putative ankyrin repeat-containing domain, PGG domain, ankyrin repeat-containing domain superfamily [Helianthus annuus]